MQEKEMLMVESSGEIPREKKESRMGEKEENNH